MHNYRLVLDLRTSKLSLTTDLKSAQLSQALIILHNSVYSISTRLVLQNSLLRYNNQKNDTVENWVRALADLEVVTGTTGGGFGGLLQAVVWDKNLGHGGPGPLNVLGGRMGLMNVTGENAQGILIPASEHNGWRPGYMGNFTNIRNETSTPELLDSGRSLHDGFPNSLYPEPSFAPADYIYKRGGLVMGPLQINQTFYMLSYTVPIISNTGPSQLLGFLTVVVNAKLIVDIMKDTRGLGDTGQTVLVGPGTWGNFYTTEESDQIQSAEHGDIPPEITFTYLFPPALTPDLVGKKYNMSRYPAVGKAYHTGLKRYKNVTGTVDVAQIGVSDIRDERLQSAGRMEHTTNAQDVEVSVGYVRSA